MKFTNRGLFRTPRRYLLLATILAVLLAGAPAQAALLLTAPCSLPAGSSGEFDVFISNPDSVSYTVAGFNFKLSVPSGAFTAVDYVPDGSSPAYIFEDFSFGQQNGLDISSDTFPYQDFWAQDNWDDGLSSMGGTTLAPNTTMALARVSYQSDASEMFAPQFVLSDTGLWDDLGAPITFNVGCYGNAIPEPTTLAIWSLLGGGGLALAQMRRRRQT